MTRIDTLVEISKLSQHLIRLGENNDAGDSALISLCSQLESFKSTKSDIKISYNFEFLSGILDKIPDPVFIKDENHKWVLLNDASCSFFGHKRDELIGKSDYDIFPASESDIYWEVDNKVFVSGKEILNEELQTNPKTGLKQILATKKNLFVDSTGNKFIVGIIRDITQQKLAEEQLVSVTESKEKLLSILAHDIKEPFNSLIGFSGLLVKNYYNYNDEKRLKFINIIDKANRENLLFIENILAWMGVQMGKIECNPVEFDLISHINESIDIFTTPIILKEINLVVDIQDNSLNVFSDVFIVKTIIRNLLSNAVKFTPVKGDISISAYKDKNNKAVISIKDNGIGMNDEQKEKLKNSSLNSTRGTTGELGVGLGLKLCFEFAEKCDGKIDFYSSLGKGTEFRFTI